MALHNKVGVSNMLQLVIWLLFIRVEKLKQSTIFMEAVTAARFEPEDAETAEITNAAFSEHGYSGNR